MMYFFRTFSRELTLGFFGFKTQHVIFLSHYPHGGAGEKMTNVLIYTVQESTLHALEPGVRRNVNICSLFVFIGIIRKRAHSLEARSCTIAASDGVRLDGLWLLTVVVRQAGCDDARLRLSPTVYL